MKEKIIKLFATQVPYIEEELEENEVYVEFNVGELLDEIDDEDVYDYAVENFNLINGDDFESSLDDFDEDDLVKELENRGHNFSYQIGEEECIEFSEDSGYTIIADEAVVGSGLDYVDAQRLEDIQKKFIDSSWDEKLVMYNKIFNL